MLERTFPAQKPPWLYPARLAGPQPGRPAGRPSLHEPGPKAPDGFYASTPSSGRPPQYGTEAGHPTSQTPEYEPPGWIVGPGETVNLDTSTVVYREQLNAGVIQPCADQSQADTTTPAHMVNGTAGIKVCTAN